MHYPVYEGVTPEDEKYFTQYIERVLDVAKASWNDGHSDFIIAINAQTDQIIAVDRKTAIQVIGKDGGTETLTAAIAEPAGPMSAWVVLMFKEANINTVNLMKMTFMPGQKPGLA